MQNIPHHWYFLPSPVLGPASWFGVADVMASLEQTVDVAKTSMTTTADEDHLTPWLDEIAAVSAPANGYPVVVVGHSAACPRLPAAVDRLLSEGWPVRAMICVDGRFPDGKAFTETVEHFAEMLDGLVRPDDYLPPWPRWWGSLVEGLVVEPAARDMVFSEAPPIPRSWFDQPPTLPELPPEVRQAFLGFGPGYQESCDRAHAAGWMTYRLDGDHLHQVVDPTAVAKTLLAMVACMESGD